MDANNDTYTEMLRQQEFAAEQKERLDALRGEVFMPIAADVARRSTLKGVLWFFVGVGLLIHGAVRYL